MKTIFSGIILHSLLGALALIAAISPVAFGWQWETHKAIAEKVCADFGCGCVSEIKDGAIAPDSEFKDFVNHHCYNTSVQCADSEYFDCPKTNGCPAIEKADYWLAKSAKQNGCEKWNSIGIASHYFSDSKVFWHKVQKEEYNGCHEPFEAKVNERIKKGASSWTITQCGVSVSYSELEAIPNDFEQFVENAFVGTAIAQKEKSNGVTAPTIKKIGNVPLVKNKCGFWCIILKWLGLQ